MKKSATGPIILKANTMSSVSHDIGFAYFFRYFLGILLIIFVFDSKKLDLFQTIYIFSGTETPINRSVSYKTILTLFTSRRRAREISGFSISTTRQVS